MLVIRDGIKVYYPKLTIRACLTIDTLFGSPTAPLEGIPSLKNQVFIFALSLQQYNLEEETIYDLFDELESPYDTIVALYSESGLINTEQEQDPVEAKETGNNEEINNEPTEPKTFEEFIKSMLVDCMSLGMTENDFYNSTLSQVVRFVEAHHKQKEQEMEQLAFFDWQLANLICMSVGRLMSKNAKYPSLEEAYPFVHVNKNNQDEVAEDGLTAEERAMIIHQEQMRQWVEQQNAKRKKQETLKEDGVE